MEEILVAVNIVEEQVPEIENSKIFYLDWNNKNKTLMGYSVGKCIFNGTRPSQGTSRGRIYVLHNGTVKTTQTRGGVNVWTGSGDVAVIYKDRREVGKHLFEVTGSVQEGYDF